MVWVTSDWLEFVFEALVLVFCYILLFFLFLICFSVLSLFVVKDFELFCIKGHVQSLCVFLFGASKSKIWVAGLCKKQGGG